MKRFPRSLQHDEVVVGHRFYLVMHPFAKCAENEGKGVIHTVAPQRVDEGPAQLSGCRGIG